MAEHGRVQRALEKAKRSREGLTGSGPRQEQGLDETAKHRAALQSLPSFTHVTFDLDSCSRNRILVPDAQKNAHASGDAAYRVLRTRLLQRLKSNDWSSIGVTSPTSGDGKSLTAINLAMSIARQGNNNVFLLDLDMRKPKLCKYMGITPPVEISSYLTGSGTPEDALFTTDVPNLILAGTTSSTDDASELLAGRRLDGLLNYIRSIAYQPIIITDLPPLLSTDDALVMATRIDAFLLVLGVGHTRRDSAAQAIDLLSEFNLAGVLLNRSDDMVQDYYGP